MNFSSESPKTSIYDLIRKIGYHFLAEDKEKREWSLIRPLSPAGYPRFHIYIKTKEGGEIDFNLHLDQKKPVYKGAPAHSGEYGGEAVEKEVERIKIIIAGS